MGEDATRRREREGGLIRRAHRLRWPTGGRMRARSVRDRGGSETLIGEGPTTVTGGDSFV
jgi:hypothetical protein